MPFSASRRELLIGGAATALSPVSAIESLATAFAGKRTMRVAHMTDFHAQPELNAPSGMRKSLQHMMALKPRPSLILGGGDLIMDSFAATEERTALQWKIFSDILNAETKVPFRPTMGNHDVWGWNKNESKTTGNEAKWGDRWFCDQFGLTKPYYSFDMGRWHKLLTQAGITVGETHEFYQMPDSRGNLESHTLVVGQKRKASPASSCTQEERPQASDAQEIH